MPEHLSDSLSPRSGERARMRGRNQRGAAAGGLVTIGAGRLGARGGMREIQF